MLLDIVFSVSDRRPRATQPWANFNTFRLYSGNCCATSPNGPELYLTHCRQHPLAAHELMLASSGVASALPGHRRHSTHPADRWAVAAHVPLTQEDVRGPPRRDSDRPTRR